MVRPTRQVCDRAKVKVLRTARGKRSAGPSGELTSNTVHADCCPRPRKPAARRRFGGRGACQTPHPSPPTMRRGGLGASPGDDSFGTPRIRSLGVESARATSWTMRWAGTRRTSPRRLPAASRAGRVGADRVPRCRSRLRRGTGAQCWSLWAPIRSERGGPSSGKTADSVRARSGATCRRCRVFRVERVDDEIDARRRNR